MKPVKCSSNLPFALFFPVLFYMGTIEQSVALFFKLFLVTQLIMLRALCFLSLRIYLSVCKEEVIQWVVSISSILWRSLSYASNFKVMWWDKSLFFLHSTYISTSSSGSSFLFTFFMITGSGTGETKVWKTERANWWTEWRKRQTDTCRYIKALPTDKCCSTKLGAYKSCKQIF